MTEKYDRGALSIILQFNEMLGGDFDQRHNCCAGGCWRKGIGFNCAKDVSVWTYDVERWVAGRPQNWRYFDVLIRVVQLTELVEVHPFPPDKGFRTLECVFYPLTRCFYSRTGSFEVDLVVACRELEVAILRPSVKSDQFPRGVIEGGPQIVDSVAYYRSESIWKFFQNSYSNAKSARCRIGFHAKSMWFFANKRGELPFEIGYMVIGPLYFLFGAGEHV